MIVGRFDCLSRSAETAEQKVVVAGPVEQEVVSSREFSVKISTLMGSLDPLRVEKQYKDMTLDPEPNRIQEEFPRLL